MGSEFALLLTTLKRTGLWRVASGALLLGTTALALQATSGRVAALAPMLPFALLGLALLRSGIGLLRDDSRLVRDLRRDPSQIAWAYQQVLVLAPLDDLMPRIVVVRWLDGDWTSFHASRQRGDAILALIARLAPAVPLGAACTHGEHQRRVDRHRTATGP